MKKSFIITSLAIFLSIATLACGKEDGADAVDTREAAAAEPTAIAGEEAAAAAEEPESDEPVILTDGPAFTVVNNEIESDDMFTPAADGYGDNESFPYARVSYPSIELKEGMSSSYPALSAALESFSRSSRDEALEELAEAWNNAGVMAEEGFDFYVSSYYDRTANVQRADDTAVSILFTVGSYYGGIHPYTWYESCFFDTQSGEQLPLSDVVNDMFALPEAIWENLTGLDEEYDFSEERDSIFPKIEEYVADGSLAWTMDSEGLHIYFDAYALMYYAFGPVFANISFEDYPGLFVEKYLPADGGEGLDERISYRDAEKEVYTKDELKTQLTGGWPGAYDEDRQFMIDCPEWDATYLAEGIFDTKTESLLILTEQVKESSDWLDADAWSYKNGIALPDNFYTGYSYIDGDVLYYTDNQDDEGLVLELYDADDGRPIASYDFSGFLNTPVAGDDYSLLEIPYAKLVDGTLYVEIAHRTYSKSQPYTGFIVAVEADSGRLLWRSDMLVANGHNFAVIDDYIVCGYGFTAEDDYLYILSRDSGAVLDKRLLKSAPDHFIVDDSTPGDGKLYVITYDTAYTYGISFG